MNVLSVDIGGTSFRIGVVDGNGNLGRFDKVLTKSVLRTGNVLDDLSAMLKQFAGNQAIDAVTVGFPATLNADRSRVIQAPNIPFMENLPVRETLQEKLGLPVFIERDVTFALCFDMQKYRLPDDGLVCGIYFGTGIGNAMLLDGKPVAGRHGTAGELGHIPVWGNRTPCGCGNVGCLEAAAGGKAIAVLQKERYPETAIEDMFVEHADEEDLLRIVDGMAVAVATEINILDPQFVLVGGGVPNMKRFPREKMNRMLHSHMRKPLPCEDAQIIFTDDEPGKSVIGGSVYAGRMLHNC